VMLTPRIYIASLSDYNAGTLHGAWIHADQGAENIQAEVSAMLSASPTAADECHYCGKSRELHTTSRLRYPECDPNGMEPHDFVPSAAEEWAIHDFEDFGSIRLGEWESFERVSELALALTEHGEAYAAYVGMFGSEYATPDDFEDRYQGEHESEIDFAYSFADDIDLFGEARRTLGPDSTLETYFNWDAWTRDLFLDSFASTPTTDFGVYVFRSH
jgi:antirestriction protein